MTDTDTPKADGAAKLSAVVAHEQNMQESRQHSILTRAQQRLEADESRREELDGEIADLAIYIERTRANIADLTRLLEQAERNHAEAKIEQKACLQSIHQLRSEGIKL